MNHKQKVKLARKLTPYPEKGKGIFRSNAWLFRKENIQKEVEKKQSIAHEMALKRKEQFI